MVAVEEHDWMLCMVFAALGVALGSFLSSVYPAFFVLSAPSRKDVSASSRKASFASWPSRILELRFLCNTKNIDGHKHTLFDACENQLGASKHPIHSTKKLNQKKQALDFCDNESSNVSEHQRSMSQLLNDSTKLDQGKNDHDACMRQLAASWYPFNETSFSDDHDGNYVQSSELVMPLLIPSKEFGLPHGNLKPDPFDPSKRHGYLSWDDYFMAIAFLSALRSKDPNRQVGACLVSQDRVILGIGYNGFPRGCSDDELPWAKMSVNNDPLQTKYPYVCHAEVNAILNKNHASACGQRLYVTMFPCNECAKIIIQAGVAEVVYIVGKNSSTDCSYVASRKLLSMAGVKFWQHQPAQQKVILDFKR